MTHPINSAVTNVVGIVIQTAPGKVDAVRHALGGMDGVDVHAVAADGRIVATAIDTRDSLAIDHLASINRTPGVVSAMLAYHEIDRPEDEPSPVAECCAGSASSSPCTCSSERA